MIAVATAGANAKTAYARYLTDDGSLLHSFIRTDEHLHGVVLVFAKDLGNLCVIGTPCDTCRSTIDALRIAFHYIAVVGIRGTECQPHVFHCIATTEADTTTDDATCLTEAGIGQRVLQQVAVVGLYLVFIVVARLHGIVLVGILRIGTAGGIDAYIVGIAVHITARDDEGGIVGTYLVCLPRQAHGTFVGTLGGAEFLYAGAIEQSCGNSVALEVGTIER